MSHAPGRIQRAVDRLRGRPIDYALESHWRALVEISGREAGLSGLGDEEIAVRARGLGQRVRGGERLEAVEAEAFALAREAARRTLGQRAYDEQILAGLALQRGEVAELATGEGKTLAAVAPAFLNALSGEGVHVLTFNDYLARRDAGWMGPVYRLLGLEVGFIQAGLDPAARRRAYAADVTYATAKEAGFDYLRDSLVLEASVLVHRAFHFAIVDEADSILIDEARVPLVIAGETADAPAGLERIAALARALRAGADFDTDEYGHNIALTEAGTARVESILGSGPLFSSENLTLHARVRNALHAEHLLQRDVDYIVRDGKVELVDDFTGRVADRRRWPDGLHAALEAKEGVRQQPEGQILGSITLQHFLGLYPKLAGMTATAEPAAEEIHDSYGLRVAVVPTHRPPVRVDHDDLVFTHKEAKREALVAEIARVHATGQPVLVGTASVGESEDLAAGLRSAGVFGEVLNAKNDEREAQVIAAAGALSAVTLSTNMAGRGTDIRLGGVDERQRGEVVALGGLYVIGSNRHESRRIDRQLRGRAGRQGDPGSSRFFVSLEDDLVRRYGVETLVSARHLPSHQQGPLASPLVAAEIARAQRIIEGESGQVRRTLYDYSAPVERQRHATMERRSALLEDGRPLDALVEECAARMLARHPHLCEGIRVDIARRVCLLTLDRCWSEHLALARDLQDDSHLLAFGGKYPLVEFQRQVGEAFPAMVTRVEEQALHAVDELVPGPEGVDWERSGLRGPSATWTYLIGENPFGAGAGLSSFHRPQLLFAAAALAPAFLLSGLAVLFKRYRDRRAHASHRGERDAGRGRT
jgi:preprotein translocase subunit SecA